MIRNEVELSNDRRIRVRIGFCQPIVQDMLFNIFFLRKFVLSKNNLLHRHGQSAVRRAMLVDLVLRRLPSHVDRVRFAAVCRLWRHVAAQPSVPPPLPWLSIGDDGARLKLQSLPDGVLHSVTVRDKGSVFGGSAFPLYLSVFGSWLLLEDSEGQPCDGYSLRNPLTGDTVRLPHHCYEPIGVNPDNGGSPAAHVVKN